MARPQTGSCELSKNWFVVFERKRRRADSEVVSPQELIGGTQPAHLSFGAWEELPSGSVVQVCHPEWRGVRTVAYSFRTPVVESAELGGEGLAAALIGRAPSCVVIQGWPPGAAVLVGALNRAGVRVKAVLHSSPAQHDAEAGEAAMISEILGLVGEGILDGVGIAKAGVPEALSGLGFPVSYVPNRAPALPEWSRIDLGIGTHVGVFAVPFWRKNVSTQILAASLLGATSHVMSRPSNYYVAKAAVVEHGELDYPSFVSLQASVDINLYVTLSECHPSTPQESYLTGVPCLTSRSSAVFRSDAELWDLTTVDEADNPMAIAEAARRLQNHRDQAMALALNWISEADRVGEELWQAFVRP